MKAYAVYWLDIKEPTFFADETSSKARYQAVRALNGLGYAVQFKDLRVKRAFEHDDIAKSIVQNQFIILFPKRCQDESSCHVYDV